MQTAKPQPVSMAPSIIHETAPAFARFTEDVLFGEVWQRTELSPRDRSLITVAALVALYRLEQLPFHLQRALDNGLTHEELAEAITHLAFYAGWPNAASAVTLLAKVTKGPGVETHTL